MAWAPKDTSQLHAGHAGSGSRPWPRLHVSALTHCQTPGLLDCFTYSIGKPESQRLGLGAFPPTGSQSHQLFNKSNLDYKCFSPMNAFLEQP